MLVFSKATDDATSLIPNGFQLPVASTVRNEPDIMLWSEGASINVPTNHAVLKVPEVFPSPRGRLKNNAYLHSDS